MDTITFINASDPYDLENDLLDHRASYKEVILEDNKVKTAREFAKYTKGPLICVVDNVDSIREQLLEEYNNLESKWKTKFSRPSGNEYSHYTVPGKIYHNVYIMNYYNINTYHSVAIIFVEKKDIEIL
jgi:hypothetical protein